MRRQPRFEISGLGIEPDVLSQFDVWDQLGTVFPRALIDPCARHSQEIPQFLNAPLHKFMNISTMLPADYLEDAQLYIRPSAFAQLQSWRNGPKTRLCNRRV